MITMIKTQNMGKSTALAAGLLLLALHPQPGLIPVPPAVPGRYEDEAEPFNRHTRRRAVKLKRSA
ncbi:MAG: hypothetical protein DI527_00680 [Chelatococcus sp.]|nr:MAG: hypothetical protein DI527_00680 [Chelatococcus sp.]